MGSIPIARSINPVDAVGLTGFPPPKWTPNSSILDAVGRETHPEKSLGRGERAWSVDGSEGASVLIRTFPISALIRWS